MFGLNGEPILIDPAVFYGDREFDIGITTVFGGFSDAFYRGYQATYPLTSGYERRILLGSISLIILINKLFYNYYNYPFI